MTDRAPADDEEFELLDLTQRGWLQQYLGDLSKASVAKQITVGGATGWCSGYLFCRVGRAAAAAMGGSLLLLQFAAHKGYIKVNWGKINNTMDKAKKTARKDMEKVIPHVAEEVSEFVKQNMFLAGGFAGGFLLGLAS